VKLVSFQYDLPSIPDSHNPQEIIENYDPEAYDPYYEDIVSKVK